jgi:hypothetical protein
MTEQNPLFDKWYLRYPRKTGKGAARRAFEKHDPDPETVEDWIRAIEAQIRWRKRAADMPRWELDKLGVNIAPWKHPATWLNQECWDDQLPSLTSPAYQPQEHTSQCGKCNKILGPKESAPGGLCANCWSLENCISGEKWDFRQMHRKLKELGLDKLEGESRESWGARCMEAFSKIEAENPGRVYGGSFMRLFG